MIACTINQSLNRVLRKKISTPQTRALGCVSPHWVGLHCRVVTHPIKRTQGVSEVSAGNQRWCLPHPTAHTQQGRRGWARAFLLPQCPRPPLPPVPCPSPPPPAAKGTFVSFWANFSLSVPDNNEFNLLVWNAFDLSKQQVPETPPRGPAPGHPPVKTITLPRPLGPMADPPLPPYPVPVTPTPWCYEGYGIANPLQSWQLYSCPAVFPCRTSPPLSANRRPPAVSPSQCTSSSGLVLCRPPPHYRPPAAAAGAPLRDPQRQPTPSRLPRPRLYPQSRDPGAEREGGVDPRSVLVVMVGRFSAPSTGRRVHQPHDGSTGSLTFTGSQPSVPLPNTVPVT